MLAREPFLILGQPTVYDPSRAPAGKHILWIMVRAEPADILGDSAGIIAERSLTAEAAEKLADRVIRQMSWQPALCGIRGPRNAYPRSLHVRRIHLAGGRSLAGLGNAAGQETSERGCLKGGRLRHVHTTSSAEPAASDAIQPRVVIVEGATNVALESIKDTLDAAPGLALLR